MEILDLIRKQVLLCESNGVEILCCPEAVIGGLADYANEPKDFAINAGNGQLQSTLTPLASDKVATIIGFTEIDQNGLLYNSAAIFHKGAVIGVYRKNHPAINKSVYSAGDEALIFTIGNLTFGIIICNDSNYPEPAKSMIAKGAKALFIPSNNGLPPTKAGPEIIDLARNIDVAIAVNNNVYVIRSDVAGYVEGLRAYGSSDVIAPDGSILCAARQSRSELIIADIETRPHVA